jgi:Uma2 family endonuclease
MGDFTPSHDSPPYVEKLANHRDCVQHRGMSAIAYQPLITVEDYLSGESLSQVKHEYVNGEVFSMAGASEEHIELAGNLYIALRSHLRGSACKAFISEMKVRLRIGLKDLFYYPDVFVACDPSDTDRYFKRLPKLIIEVLSPSTERTDRLEKLEHYTTLPSLEEYVLVYQDCMKVIVFRRRAGWVGEMIVDPISSVVLESVGLTLPLQTIYDNIRLGSGDEHATGTESH